jgi:RimJ/RimL family protein N-acetyltransferase
MILQPLTSQTLYLAASLYREGVSWMPYSVTDISQEVAEHLLSTPTNAVWYTLLHNTNILGLAGYENIRWIDQVAEPYIAISLSERQKGLGYTMGCMLRDIGFNNLNLRRIQSIVLADSPSRHILTKMNFKEEGKLTNLRYKDGKYVDGIMYSLLRNTI